MNRSLLIACAILQLLSSQVLRAEQEVTLKAGTKIIGDVTVGEQNVKVKIGDSEVSFPLHEVELVRPIGSETRPDSSAERLLTLALELRLQSESLEEAIALLADAYRQAPKDARIAYWYAKSLADTGLGKEAKAVFDSRHKEIAQAYPGLTDKLANLIQEKIDLEGLPATLVAKLNQLNKSIGVSPNPNLITKYARFRVLDQNSKPIDKAAIDVISNGNDRELMGFPGGYFLFTYNKYRDINDKDCRLVISWPDLESKQFELPTAADHVENAGTFIATRLNESAKVPYKFVVVDPAGKPILAARVVIQPDGRSNARSLYQTGVTDSGGLSIIEAFPLGYDYTVSAEGYKGEKGNVALTNASQDREERVVLYPALTGSIRYSWSLLEEEKPTQTKEIILPIGQPLNSRQHDAESVSWLQAVQVKDTVTLQRGPAFYGERSIPGETLWVRRIPDELIKESALEYYSQFDLKNIDSVKEKIPETKIHRDKGGAQRDNFSFSVRQGELYVGKVPGLNRETGRPAVLSFKVYIEEIETERPQD